MTEGLESEIEKEEQKVPNDGGAAADGRQSQEEQQKEQKHREKLVRAKRGQYGKSATVEQLIGQRRKQISEQVQGAIEQMPFLYKLGVKWGFMSPASFYQKQVNNLSKSIVNLEGAITSETKEREKFFKEHYSLQSLRESALYVIKADQKKQDYLNSQISEKEAELDALAAVMDEKVQLKTANGKTREQLLEEVSLHRQEWEKLENEKNDLLADAEQYHKEKSDSKAFYMLDCESINASRELISILKSNRGQYVAALKALNSGTKQMGLIDAVEQAAILNAKLEDMFKGLLAGGVATRPGQYIGEITSKMSTVDLIDREGLVANLSKNGSFDVRYKALVDSVQEEYKTRQQASKVVPPVVH